MNYVLLALVFWNIFALNNAQTQDIDDLVAVVQVFRHGQNTPYYFYPQDPHKDSSVWTTRKGSLTSEGKQQEYNLGKYTKAMYEGFLPTEFNWSQFMGHSTDTERTKISCQCVMAGMFSQDSDVWSERLPLYRYNFRVSEEAIFSSTPECRIFDTELANVLINGELFENIETDYAEEIEILETNAGVRIRSIFQIFAIYETLYVEEQIGLSLPNWTQSVYPEPMRTISGYALKSLTYTEEAKRLAAGAWLFDTLSYFRRYFDGHTYLPKYQIYSGHDTNLASIMNTLEVFDPHVPNFGDSIFFELRNKSGEPVVNLWHKTESGLEQLSIACCDLDCPLDTARDLLKRRLIDKRTWKYECLSPATKYTFIPREEKRIDIRRKREEAMLVLNRKRPEYRPFTWLRK